MWVLKGIRADISNVLPHSNKTLSGEEIHGAKAIPIVIYQRWSADFNWRTILFREDRI